MDLFSLGTVIYEMAAGRRPFAGKTSALIFDAILHDTPIPATRLNPTVPEGLQQIIDKAIEKDRRLRYRSAGDIRADLLRLRRDGTEHPPRVDPRGRARRSSRWTCRLSPSPTARRCVSAG